MKGEVARTPYCCGLFEIGHFESSWSSVTKEKIERSKMAYICVTRWHDIKQKAFLKKCGFKKVGKWKNPNTLNTLTLWARMPEE